MDEGAGGLLGEGEVGDGAALLEGGGRPAGGHEHRQQGDRGRELDRLQRVGDVLAAGQHRRDEDCDHRVHLARVGEGLERAAVLRGAARRRHVDRVDGGGDGRQQSGKPGLEPGGEDRHLEPAGLEDVGAEDAGPAGVGDDPHPRTRRQRLAGQQRGDVEELGHGLGSDHAGLGEEGVDGYVGVRQQGAGVGGGRPRPGRRPAALDDHYRLAAGDPAGDAGELARVAEGLQVEHADRGLAVGLPVLEDVVAGEVGLVPDGDERGDPHPAGAGELDSGDAEGSALRHQPDGPGRRQAGGEGGVEADSRRGVEDAEAVGADQPHPRLAADVEQLPLPAATLLAHLGEAGGDHDQRLDAGGGALAGDLHHLGGGNGDHRQLGRRGQGPDRRVGGHRLDHRGGPVDRVDRSLEIAVEQVPEDAAADRGGGAGSADHRHRLRLQH